MGGFSPSQGADPMGTCKGNHRAYWQCSSRADEMFAGTVSGGLLMECGLMTSLDTSGTTVLSEKTGKVTATLAPIHNHLGQKQSECSPELLLCPAHHPYQGAASNTAQDAAPPALGRSSGAPAQGRP